MTEDQNINDILLSMSEYYAGSLNEAKEAIAAIYNARMMIVDRFPHSAKVSWAIEVLRNHNLWRRGNDTKDPANPTDLGNAIEIAIGVMDRVNRQILQKGEQNDF